MGRLSFAALSAIRASCSAFSFAYKVRRSSMYWGGGDSWTATTKRWLNGRFFGDTVSFNTCHQVLQSPQRFYITLKVKTSISWVLGDHTSNNQSEQITSVRDEMFASTLCNSQINISANSKSTMTSTLLKIWNQNLICKSNCLNDASLFLYQCIHCTLTPMQCFTNLITWLN